MKFAITAGGKYPATILLTETSPPGFSGSIVSTEFGTGAITNGVRRGETLTGRVHLDGHDADFSATVDDDGSISGTIRVGWFWSMGFTGHAVT